MTDTHTLAPAPSTGGESTPAAPRKRRRIDVRSGAETGALLLLVVIFSVLNKDSFPTVVNLRTILDQASTPLIIGVGATLVILLGCIDLSVEGFTAAKMKPRAMVSPRRPKSMILHDRQRGRQDGDFTGA